MYEVVLLRLQCIQIIWGPFPSRALDLLHYHHPELFLRQAACLHLGPPLLGFYLASSSHVSCATSFCLRCCLHFYVCGRLDPYLSLGEVASVGGILCNPSRHTLSSSTLYTPGVPLKLQGVLLLWQAGYVGGLVGLADL